MIIYINLLIYFDLFFSFTIFLFILYSNDVPTRPTRFHYLEWQDGQDCGTLCKPYDIPPDATSHATFAGVTLTVATEMMRMMV